MSSTRPRLLAQPVEARTPFQIAAEVMRQLADRPSTIDELSAAVGVGVGAVRIALDGLLEDGIAVPARDGKWGLL